MNQSIPENALAEFFAEADEIIQRVNSQLSQVQNSSISDDAIDSVYRDIHTLKGSSQLFGFKNIGMIAHALEASLEPVRKKKISLTPKLLDIIFKSLDFIDRLVKNPDLDLKEDAKTKNEIQTLVPKLVTISTDIFAANLNLINFGPEINEKNDTLHKHLNSEEQKKSTKSIAPATFPAKNNVITMEPKMPSTAKNSSTSEVSDNSSNETSTIRVQVSLLDRLMNLVGEMVLVRNQVLQYSLKSDDYEFLNLSQRLDLVTSELQEDVMKTRMQPIGSVLSKFQRVIRDLSRDLGKQIDLVIKGSETEIDKSLLEAIKDPLTHIIRNSCDHGLEKPEERIKNGKKESGHIFIHAYHEGGQVVIEVKDDGRGLNYSKITDKAIEKKIITPEKALQMTDREIGYLIFAPGFSTADSVSALSGRGVGMDVVRTNIEKVGGNVELSSELNKGTTIRLRIPLTLAIVPAMIVKSANELFAIPQVKLQELVRVDMDDSGPKVEMLQDQPMYRLRGQLMPLVFMDKVLGLVPPDHDYRARKIFNIVVLSGEGDPFGLVVDEIRDTADIVVKPLSHFLKKLNIYSGATIMGDGSVSMIIDVLGLGEVANVVHPNQKKTETNGLGATANKKITSDSQELLFFELNANGKFCLPLTLVQRLEEFDRNQIEQSGKDRIVKYRDAILPLINLNQYFKYEQKSAPKSDKVSVIVVSKRRRLFGIEVNYIFDVLDIQSPVENPLKEIKGILGNIIVGDQIATVIDVLNIIEDLLGEEESDTANNNKKAAMRRPTKALKILLAEDTIFFVRQVTKILEKQGHQVFHAPDGEAALKMLKTHPVNTFNLILSDIEMPNMNGFDLAKSIRKEAQYAKIPLIALTTRFREADVTYGKECGFNKYLEKINTDQLLDAINEESGGN